LSLSWAATPVHAFDEDDSRPTFWIHNATNNEEPEYMYEPPEDYFIGLIVQPCGVNNTKQLKGFSYCKPLGYDCCMDQFGMGEYGFLKPAILDRYDAESSLGSFLPGFRQLARHDEIYNNIDLVNEHGVNLDHKYSRRADDDTFVDYSCAGERDPFLHCLSEFLGARRSRFTAPCWDHNQTIDATLPCDSSDGVRQPTTCMQIAYSQTATIHTCGGVYSNDTECGTYIEVHRRNGSPYDPEHMVLSDTKVTTPYTSGMTTSTIPMTYKHKAGVESDTDSTSTMDESRYAITPTRTLCAYQETKVRVGSMVVINHQAPQCCCPSSYSQRTTLGSFFCPRKKNTKHGPFADIVDTLQERFQNDKEKLKYPLCHNNNINGEEEKDILMCSRQSQVSAEVLCDNDGALCVEQGRFYTRPCHISDLSGTYAGACPLGDVFQSCAMLPATSDTCAGSDTMISFQDELGKIIAIPDTSMPEGPYSISFNEGRTSYQVNRDQFDLVTPDSNYELWWVQRRGKERKIRKKKPFRVVHPPCTYDTSAGQFLPFAQWDLDGTPMERLNDYNHNGTLLPSFD
jgi:hypothetical protein